MVPNYPRSGVSTSKTLWATGLLVTIFARLNSKLCRAEIKNKQPNLLWARSLLALELLSAVVVLNVHHAGVFVLNAKDGVAPLVPLPGGHAERRLPLAGRVSAPRVPDVDHACRA